MPQGLGSRLVHAGRDDFRTLGVHCPPLDRSTTYPLSDLDAGGRAVDRLAEGAHDADSSVYGRLHNPTVARWEDAIAELEHAGGAVAFGSGMAAITAVLLAAGAPGRHVVAVRPLYGGTDHLLTTGILGSRVSWCAPHEVADAIEDDTCLAIVETPGNPTLQLVDIADIVGRAGDVPVAVDNTFATPILQRPLDHGAAYSIHSATKYLGGHGDVTAGVVATTPERCAGVRQVRILTGALLDPQAAWLLHRSLPTLAARVTIAQSSAQVLAERLAAHPAVARVRYPGIGDSDPHGIVGRQMRGRGAMLAFEVEGGYAAASQVMKAVEMITPAVSLGSVDSLIEHPAALTHRIVDEQARDEHGVTANLLRMSVGMEDVEDLWADLAQALSWAELGDTVSDDEETVGVGS